MASDKLREYQVFTDKIRMALIIVGLWPMTEPTIFYRALPFINILCSGGLTVFIINFMRLNISNINIMTKGMSAGASSLTTMLKVTQ